MSLAARRTFGRMAFQSPLLKPLTPTSHASKIADLNLIMDRVNTPVWVYQIKYSERMPNQSPLSHSAISRNLEAIAEFIDIMMRMNRSVVNKIQDRFQATCGCDSEYACRCSCWRENYGVYELFGDIMYHPPTVFKMMRDLEEDPAGVTYRIGHVPRLDDQMSDWPRFQFEVERMIERN